MPRSTRSSVNGQSIWIITIQMLKTYLSSTRIATRFVIKLNFITRRWTVSAYLVRKSRNFYSVIFGLDSGRNSLSLKNCATQWKIIRPKKKLKKTYKSFDIENEEIRCTDANALQSLIPYVKRLFQLFPQIKENTKHALSSDVVRNKYNSLKQGVTSKGLAKAQWNLTLMLWVLQNF